MNYVRSNALTATLPERLVLTFCDVVYDRKHKEVQEKRVQRMNMIKHIALCAEDGKVLLVEGGRDCDGVQYEGRTHVVDATIKAVEAEMETIRNWADGPVWFSVARVSDKKHIAYSSRDLTLEAFEDGHQHCLHG